MAAKIVIQVFVIFTSTKKRITIITHARKRNNISPTLTELQRRPLEQRIDYKILLYVYKILNAWPRPIWLTSVYHTGKNLRSTVNHYDDVTMGGMASQITSLTIVYSTVYSGADQRKHQSPVSLAFVRGIHRGPVNSPHKWPVTRKLFPFDDVIMITLIPHYLDTPYTSSKP